MSFMKNIWKPVANIAGAALAPFTGGLSGLAAGALTGLGGAAGSAYGASGTQGKQLQNFSNQSAMQGTQNQTGSFDNLFSNKSQFQFDPYMQAMRNTIGSIGLGEIQRAQQPIYGEGVKAGIIGDANAQAEAAQAAARSAAARSGRLDSGATDQAISDINTARYSGISSQLSQLPYLEEMARRQGVQSAMAGVSPFVSLGFQTGSTGSGTQSGTSKSDMTSSQTQTSSGDSTTEMQGPGFLKGLASNLGGLGGYMFQDWWKNRQNQPATPMPTNSPNLPSKPYIPPFNSGIFKNPFGG